MLIAGMSDTHGTLKYIQLKDEVDVLCISGDFSPLKLQRSIYPTDKKGTMRYWIKNEFIPWLQSQPARHIVFIPGNHDFVTECEWFPEWIGEILPENMHYLCNGSITIDDVAFYGCPYSDLQGWAWYSDENPDNYTIKGSADIMLVHAAPDYNGLGQTVTRWGLYNYGSKALMEALHERAPKLLLCGHIHGGSHRPEMYDSRCLMLNVSVKDEDYSESYYPAIIDFQKAGSQAVMRVIKSSVIEDRTEPFVTCL